MSRPDSKPAEAAAGQPKRGGTYTHGSVQEPDRFWGPITGLVVSTEVAHLTNSPLIKVNEKLEYVPALATQVPTLENGGISQDGLDLHVQAAVGRELERWHPLHLGRREAHL